MKNKKDIFLGGLLAGLALVLTSCLFESDENGMDNWLADHGMPNSYSVQKVDVSGLKIDSFEVYLDTTPKSADNRATIGKYSNIVYDLALDVAFTPSDDFLKDVAASDSAGAFLAIFWDKGFYTAPEFPKDSMPATADVKFNVSWKMDVSKSDGALDSLAKISDKSWYGSLEWDEFASADTTLKVSVNTSDTALRLDFPAALVDSIKAVSSGTIRLQLKISAPEAEHGYRFLGDATSYPPKFALYATDSNFIAPKIYRMATLVHSEEDCQECPVLHGGLFDSLVVTLPSEPILKALSEHFGDEFPFEGDGFDVRQNVLYAELTMARDDSQGNSELGLPIQVVVGSYVDSANTKVRRMESYRLNKDVILENGHQNLVFHEGDSLTIQLTHGLREFVNKAKDGRSVQFIMRLGYPFLQEKDTTYATYITDEGDTNYVFLGHFDHARYDFSTSMEKPASLKLWLASKRGDEE